MLDRKKLMEEIGLFVVDYGHLENAIHWVMYKYSGIPNEICRVFIAKKRTEYILECMRLIVSIRALDEMILKDLIKIGDDLNRLRLSAFRDEIIHGIWGFNDTQAIRSNSNKAKKVENIVNEEITPEMLSEKRAVIREFTQRFLAHLGSQEELAILPDWAKKIRLKRAPWLGKRE